MKVARAAKIEGPPRRRRRRAFELPVQNGLVLDGPFAETKELVLAYWPPRSDLRRELGGAGHYASVNGLHMYYQVHGSGRPLLLLHGALTTIEASFGSVLSTLAADRQIIAVEQQAHGRTADIDRIASYAQMADDTAELLRQLDVAQADVFGFSMGAVIALELAVRHPGLVRKLVIVSGCYNEDGYHPELVKFMREIDPSSGGWANHPLGASRRLELAQNFQRVAPQTDRWVAALARTKQAFSAYQGLRHDDLRAIRAPALLVGGDDGVILPQHISEMSRFLPSSRCELFEKVDHTAIVARALPFIPAFLDAAWPDQG